MVKKRSLQQVLLWANKHSALIVLAVLVTYGSLGLPNFLTKARTVPRPAFSISTIPGIPYLLIAAASSARICSAVAIFIVNQVADWG